MLFPNESEPRYLGCYKCQEFFSGLLDDFTFEFPNAVHQTERS